jgi:hypothetical protein
MSDTTRTHRPNTATPRTSANRGLVATRADGTPYTQDRVRWPASQGTFRYADALRALATPTEDGAS